MRYEVSIPSSPCAVIICWLIILIWQDSTDSSSQLSFRWEFGVFSVQQWGHVSFLEALILSYQFFSHSEWKMWSHSFVTQIWESASKFSRQMTQLFCLYFGFHFSNAQAVILLKVCSMYWALSIPLGNSCFGLSLGFFHQMKKMMIKTRVNKKQNTKIKTITSPMIVCTLLFDFELLNQNCVIYIFNYFSLAKNNYFILFEQQILIKEFYIIVALVGHFKNQNLYEFEMA